MTGYKFRRQVPIGRCIADFVCHEARLIVEIDGGQHDRSSPQEAERSGFLEKEGYRILRFWNNEVLANPDGVHQTIADELGRITPTQPSPIMGEGFCLPMNNLRSTNSWRSDPVKASPGCDRRSRRLASRLSLEPSPSMGEGWEGVMLLAAQVET